MRLLYEQLTDIPLGFTEVEYLESSGTQYIDTDVIFGNSSHTYKWDIGAQAVNTSDTNYNWFCGFFEGGTYSAGTYSDTTTNYNFYAVGTYYQNGQVVTSPLTNGNKYGIIRNVSTITNFAGTLPVILFGRNQSNGVKCEATKKVFYYKIYDNDTLVRDFVPCLDSSNVPCMWDKVEKKAYYNEGTGTFSYGRKIIPVEYLESTGTQYINTNWIPNANGRVELQGAYTEVGSSHYSTAYYLFAQHGGTNARFNIGQYNNALTSFSFDVTSANRITDYPLDTNKHIFGINARTKQTFIDSNTYENPSVADFGSTSNPSYIFARNVSNAASAFSKAKIYYCKIWDDEALVRDFIPCKDENGTGYLFDRVTHTCFLNAGSGNFLVGEILPKQKVRFLQGEKARPYYCEVEYLESTGTQYIDTGITADLDTTEFEISANDYNTPSVGCQFGAYSNNFNYYMLYSETSNVKKIVLRFGNVDETVDRVAEDRFVKTEYKGKKVYYNGVLVGTVTTTGTQSHSLPVFCRWTNTAYSYYATTKINKLKIWESGTLVRDLIPVLDWNMTPCMYDKVSGQFFYNQGTGDFSYGREIHYVDYLESTGTQYILTGFTPTLNTDFELELSSTSTGINRWAVGCPTWVGVHYKGSTNEVGITCSSASAYQQYTPYNHDNSRLTMKLVGNTVYANGVSLGTLTKRAGTSDFALFGYRDANQGATLLFDGSIYKFKIWDNNTLVRDYLPAIDENGVGFMFDTVTHTIFDNAGTGSFNYNPVEIEYLESSGTQYIDTGIKSTDLTSFDMFFIPSENTQSYQVYLSSESNGTFTFAESASDITSVYLRYGGNKTLFATGLISSTTPNRAYINNKEFIVNGTNCGSVTSDVLGTVDENVYIGHSSIVQRDGKFKINELKLYTSVLARDFIPVFKDGSAGMYDKENKVFYPNAGTGTFSVGKIVERKNSVIRFLY